MFLRFLFIFICFNTTFARVCFSQQITPIDKNWITTIKNNSSDTLYVINFWATWCKPCVEEMPIFERLNKEYATQKVKVILVSNDFKKHIESKLKPFLREKKIQSTVLLMTETNPNDWIELADKSWEGSIPATMLILGAKKRYTFHEGILTYEKLKSQIELLLH